MADMHTPLRECPFCGGEAEFSQTGRNELTLRCVGVQPSGLRGCGPMYRQRVLRNRHTLDWLQGIMVETWNRRTPSQDAETIKALEAQIATKDAALRDADYALSNLIDGFEFDDDDPDGPCQAEELCGNRMCEECGCLKDKRDAARAALAGSAS